MARSRYANNPTLDGNQYATWTSPLLKGFKEHDVLKGIQTFDYVVQVGDRIDHLAERFLGNGQYWWVIAFLNNINYPFRSGGFYPGVNLRIPDDVDAALDRILT